MHPRLLDDIRTDGLVTRRPGTAHAVDWAVKCGELVRLVRNVYTTRELATRPAIRAAAISIAHPIAVITGSAAAALTWWPELVVGAVDVASATGFRGTGPGYRWERRLVPDDLVRWTGLGLRVAVPALSVLDLIPERGGDVVDEALRRRAVRMTDLWEALTRTPGRRGNRVRLDVLKDSRDEPWSEPERLAHRHLRRARLRGWQTNYRVRLDQATYFIDIAFPRLRIAIEIDGFEFHSSRAAFENDRAKDSRLVAAGWIVLRFSARQVGDYDAFVTCVRGVVRRRARRGRVLDDGGGQPSNFGQAVA